MPASHGAAVAVYAHDIAKELGLSDEMCKLALLCGLVHDIGKHNVVADLIEKPGELTPGEFEVVKTHAIIGEQLLRYVSEVVRHHHERFDGNGYPDHLGGQNIPIIAKIIGVADAYNAMTGNRPYRTPKSPEQAISILEGEKGKQFDPVAVDAFITVLARGSHEYREGRKIAPEFENILFQFAEW